MRETEIASKVIKELRTYPETFVINIAGGTFQQAGLPDALILTSGIHIFVEFKGAETKVEPIQLRIGTLIRTAKGAFFIVRFLESNKWHIWVSDNEGYTISFKTFEQGVKLLLDVLLDLVKGTNVCIPVSKKPSV